MSAPNYVDMPKAVKPGETIDLSVDMIAPTAPGKYTAYFMLVNQNGVRFGTGSDAKGAFWANIDLEQENRTFQITSDNFGAFIENLVAFLEGEDIPVTHSETVRIMAVREACLKASRQPGIWIEV